MNEFSLSEIFPVSITGEWGSEPVGFSNALALRAADFTKDCKLRGEIGAPRLIPVGKLEAKALKNGDILIEKSGGSPDQPVGRVVFFDREDSKTTYIHSNFLQLLRVSDGFDKRFSYYLLNFLYFSGYVYRYQQQTTGIINLKLENYLRERVRVPSQASQEKIAQVLQTIDQTVEKTEALIEKYQQIKAGLMHDLFTRGIGPDGKLRPPREEAPELYQETAIGWIPSDWQIVNLGSLIGPIESGWSPTCEGEPAPQGDWGVLKTTAVVWDGYAPDENKKLPAVLNGRSSIETKPGDLLITRKGPVERVGVAVSVADTPSFLMFPDTVFRTRLISDLGMSVEFLALAMQSNQVQRYWDQRKVGLAEAQVNLNHGILRGTPIVKPPKKEQIDFLKRYDAALSKLASLRRDRIKAQKLKEGLMKDLLTGEVEVEVSAKAEVSNV